MARDPHLDKLIQDLKTKKFREGEAKGLMDKVGETLKEQFGPALQGMGKELKDAVAASLKDLKMPEMPAMPEQKMPEIPAPIVNVPEFNIPTPQVHVNVPTVNVPPISVPAAQVNFPPAFKALLDYDRKNPMPVMMVDPKGNPFYEFGGGGSHGPTVLSDIAYQGRSLIDATTTPSQPALRISGTISAAAASSVSLVNSDGTYYNSDNPLPITAGTTLTVNQLSGANWSVAVQSFTGSVAASIIDSSGVQYSGSNPIPVTGTVAATKSGTWAIDNPVSQGDAATALRVVVAGNSDSSVSATQVGTWNIGTVTSITNSTAVALTDSSGVQYSGSNPLPTTASLSVAQGQGDAATAMRVVVAGNSDSSVSVNSWNGNTVATGLNETNSGVLRVVQMTDATNSVNVTTFNGNAPAVGTNEITNGVLRVMEVSANTTSTNVTTFNGNAPATGTNETTTGVLRTILMSDTAVSTVVNSGTITTVTTVTGITNSLQASIIDSSGVQYSGSNPLPITIVSGSSSGTQYNDGATPDQAGGIGVMSMLFDGGSAQANLGSSYGVQDVQLTGFDGSLISITSNALNVFATNPVAQGDAATALRVILAGNADSSVSVTSITGPIAQGDAASALRVVLAGNADSSVFVTGFADSAIVYQARTTNPTAKSDGADVRPSADKLGRQITRPYQMRDLTLTAYVSLTNGTETTLLSGSAGNLHDLIWIMAANTSSAAQQIDIREVTAGNIVMQLYIPANSTAGIAPALPWPQSSTGNNWTVDNADVTNSTINITALFVRET